jgi:putative peptidoglycan lipid II flippase
VKRQTIIAGASIMMVAALLSRLLGWVRDRAIGHFWGSTGHTDAYWAAFNVPDLLYYLLAGGALGAALIPVFVGYLVQREEKEAWRVANTLVTLFGLCAAVGILIIMIFAPQFVMLVAPGFERTRGHAAVMECAGYVRILAPMVFFTVLSALCAAILQSHRHFTAPAMAWPVYNFGIIAGAFVGGGWVARRYHSDQLGLKVLCLGVLVGALLLVVVQLPSLLARGFRYRPSLDLRHTGVREVIRIFLPVMAGLAFTQICLLWLPGFFGSYFREGAITSLRYANRLVVLPLGLWGIAISTAAFPAMAERIALGQLDEFRKLFSNLLRTVLFLAVPCTAALIALAGPMLRLLWRTGRMNENAITMAELSLLYYAISLIGLSGLQIVNRAFYSLRDGRTPALVGIGYTAVTVIGTVIAMQAHSRLGYATIAAATSVGVTIGLVVLLALLRRRLGGVDGRAIAASFLRITFASALAGAIAYWVSELVGRRLAVPATRFLTAASQVAAVPGAHGSNAAVAIQVLASLVAGAVSYLVVLRLLRAPEITDLRAVIRRRRSAGQRSPAE